MIRSEFANAIEETTETETEQRETEYRQNDNNVVGRHDFFPDHLMTKMKHVFNGKKTLKTDCLKVLCNYPRRNGTCN